MARYVLPDYTTLDHADAGLDDLTENDPNGEIASMLDEVRYGGEGSDVLWHHRMAGPPLPEQDDPRYMAAEISGTAPGEWTLLLQVGVAELLNGNADGTIYFLILDADLADRDFEAVVGVYQQT